MKNLLMLFFAFSMFALVSCGGEKEGTEKHTSTDATSKDGLALMEQKCYACHNPKTASHDEIIAPPMVAVKRHYLEEYPKKTDFVAAFVKWAKNPNENDALMPGAVNQFNVMPKQDFKDADIAKIATYVFDNEIEAPEWFGAHEKEMHGGDDKGNGMGKGADNWKKGIALVSGTKWKSDAQTMTHIKNLQKILRDNKQMESPKDFVKLSATLSEEMDGLFNDCTMEGPDHDALHKYLMPLIYKKDKLKEIKNIKMGKKVVEKITEQLAEYQNFFQ